MERYWTITLDEGLPFSIKNDPLKGLCVICKIADTSVMIEKLYGWSEEIPREILRSSDDKQEVQLHYSVIASEGKLYVCYGPLSLINHSCTSKATIITEPDNNCAKKKVLETILEVEEGEEWEINVGEEITIRYGDSFDGCLCEFCKSK
jgi:hypothetical protein